MLHGSYRWQTRDSEWRIDYNHHRPHSALGNLTPSAFMKQL
jgi:putative transposase